MARYDIFINNSTSSRLPRGLLQKNTAKLLQLLGYPAGSALGIVFVGRRKMTDLNRKFRGKNRSTNVLSFGPSGKEKKFSDPTIGEIFVFPGEARQSARRAGRTFYQELTYLILHAILHMKGYEHGSEAKARRMEAEEKKILKKFQINF